MSARFEPKQKNALSQLLNDDEAGDELFEPAAGQRRRPARTGRRPAQTGRPHKPKVSPSQVVAAIAERPDPGQPAASLTFAGTLDVTNSERDWLRNNLSQFYDGQMITSVLRRVKGGKEANVYVCAAHPDRGMDLVAAKLYRPRMLRNLRNDSQYRQGRPVLNGDGQVIGTRDWRMHKAIAKKSSTGLEAQQTSWVDYEFQTMRLLHNAGVSVPRPLRHSEHAILMEYLGDEVMPAPMLSQITLERDEAPLLFEQLLRDVDLMLANHVVHGDFSAYNVLYWEGQVKIIDLPQVVDPRQNQDAYAIFRRDVERICQYFARYGINSQPARLAREMWQKHAERDAAPLVG